jgi:hypothetical protein
MCVPATMLFALPVNHFINGGWRMHAGLRGCVQKRLEAKRSTLTFVLSFERKDCVVRCTYIWI